MLLPIKFPAETVDIPHFGTWWGNYLAFLPAILVFFALALCRNDVASGAEKYPTRIVRLQSPWDRGSPPASRFDVSMEGSGLKIQGEVVDSNFGGSHMPDAAPNADRTDRILFAWSHSPLALDHEAIEIFPDGQFELSRRASLETGDESNGQMQPSLRVIETATGFRFTCEIARIQTLSSNAAANQPIYIAVSQIAYSPEGESSRSYCSSIPMTLNFERLHPSLFASLESFPSEEQEAETDDTLARSKLAYSNLRVAELELRNKWNHYTRQPVQLELTQKWFENIANFPDAERFLEKTRDKDCMRSVRLDDNRITKKFSDARAETINHLLGQNWSVHLSQIEDFSDSLPLLISTAPSSIGVPRNDSLAIWLESERLQIAVLQNEDAAFWGSTSWPPRLSDNSTKPTNITLTSDGSTNGLGYELYTNSEPLSVVSHNPNNLILRPDSPLNTMSQSEPTLVDWTIKTKNARLLVDFYNTKLTPVEVMSLDPDTKLLSWAELTSPQHQSWLDHYVFCIDPEGRYFLESLKHYTSSQAELLRRSRKPAKK